MCICICICVCLVCLCVFVFVFQAYLCILIGVKVSYFLTQTSRICVLGRLCKPLQNYTEAEMMMIGLWTEEKNKKKGGRWYNDLELDISNNCSIDATAKSCVDRSLRDNFFYDIFRPRVVFPCSILGKRLLSLWTISLSPKTSAESIEIPRKDHLDELQQSLEWPNFAFFTPTRDSRKVTRLTQCNALQSQPFQDVISSEDCNTVHSQPLQDDVE